MVLYINGNYPYHSLHRELVSKLADKGNDIVVYVPLRGKECFGKYILDTVHVKIIYDDVLTIVDRAFFLQKVHKIAKKIENKVDIKKVDCILAGTVYSDGAVAYILAQKYNIPFSVTVRQTDVTYHMKWRPYLYVFIKNLLKSASNIIFISPTYKRFFEKFDLDFEKYAFIPNAVNDYWFENCLSKREKHSTLTLVFVGEITPLKNVKTILKVISFLKEKGIEILFNVVGNGVDEESCRKIARSLGIENQVIFHGWQNGKEKIKCFYDISDIFIMLSFRETFGTVYVEALSQGLPIVYTKDQGIDGYFENGIIGYACNPTDVDEVAQAVLKIYGNYEKISENCSEASKRFQWETVANQYNQVLNNMRLL